MCWSSGLQVIPWAVPALVLLGGSMALGQTVDEAEGTVTICGQKVTPPANLPPPGSPPVFWLIVPCFEAQGGQPLVEAQTYVYYIQSLSKISRPSQNHWTPWNERIEHGLVADFRRLWGTNFLDNLTVDVRDYAFENGVVGKVALFHMEERHRVK
ncbi:MAG: hypothetical protein ACRD2X_18150, partial [Vicinamibacteraceae bacterium]